MWLPEQQARQQAPPHTAGLPPLVGVDAGGVNTCLVHRSRLVLAGSAAIPALVMASRFGRIDDFDTRTNVGTEQAPDYRTLATDGFWVEAGDSRANELHGMIAQEGLFIFGDEGEIFTPAAAGFAPGEITLRQNSWYGTDPGRVPIISGSLVVFVQGGGQDVRGFVFSEQENKYLAPSLFARTGPLLPGVADLTLLRSTDTRPDTVYVVSAGADGKVGVMALTDDAQRLPAWSVWETAGVTRAATSARTGLVVAVERGGRLAMERVGDPRMDRWDAAWTVTAPEERALPRPALPAWMQAPEAGAVRWRWRTGEQHQEAGLPVAGAEPLPDTVPAGRTLEVGLPYERVVRTTPYVAQTQVGHKVGLRRSRIMDAGLFLYSEVAGPAASVEVNAKVVRFKPSDRRRVVAEGPAGTELVRCGGMRGWRRVSDLRFVFRGPVAVAALSFLATG